ncbi:hypothetical protein M9H77_03721 [Catharanthus roseus]|uniref:Uncharacterized protein n=1 Tax=Catharanthus roseus TaxID=4058 RepID=A0ACC0CBZ2_CATRO|nr:hypothetical protein M9H77_03721 [Catharanthus roseus]
MELDESNVGEKSDHKVTWTTTSDDQDYSISGHHVIRSYRCSFCERGFSNAQALGGHMNIHRKDRAKLKQDNFSGTDLTLDFITNKDQPPLIPLPQPQSESEFCHGIRCCTTSTTPKRPCKSPTEEIIAESEEGKDDKLQLRLSIETSSSSSSNENDELIISNSGSAASRRQVKIRSMQLMNLGTAASALGTELDLELRLGSEPQQAKTKG